MELYSFKSENFVVTEKMKEEMSNLKRPKPAFHISDNKLICIPVFPKTSSYHLHLLDSEETIVASSNPDLPVPYIPEDLIKLYCKKEDTNLKIYASINKNFEDFVIAERFYNRLNILKKAYESRSELSFEDWCLENKI